MFKKLILIAFLVFMFFCTSAHAAVKAFHFVLQGVTTERGYWMVDKAYENGFNTLIVLVSDGVQLDNQVWIPTAGAWTKSEFTAWVSYAKGKGLNVVPELKLLTHQEKFFGLTPPTGVMYNRNTYNGSSLTYRLVFPLIDELIAIMHPTRFHIGHDELAGYSAASAKKWLYPDGVALPAIKFLNDTIALHDYLAHKGITTWMWADMLMSPSEFPTMIASYFHGGLLPDFGKVLRYQLPKDIVLCDWHYFDTATKDFPSIAKLASEGFKTLGATWELPDAFSNYAAAHGAKGMIATTWFYVQNRDWNTVEKIMVNSGLAFNRAFP